MTLRLVPPPTRPEPRLWPLHGALSQQLCRILVASSQAYVHGSEVDRQQAFNDIDAAMDTLRAIKGLLSEKERA